MINLVYFASFLVQNGSFWFSLINLVFYVWFWFQMPFWIQEQIGQLYLAFIHIVSFICSDSFWLKNVVLLFHPHLI